MKMFLTCCAMKAKRIGTLRQTQMEIGFGCFLEYYSYDIWNVFSQQVSVLLGSTLKTLGYGFLTNRSDTDAFAGE